MKTVNDMLTDFFHVVSNNVGIAGLSGGVYKNTRPTESNLEDTVLHIIPGINGKFLRDGFLYVKIFYNDVQNGDYKAEDSKRGGELEALLIELSNELINMPEYAFYVETRETYPEAVEEIDQHFVILKINFKYLT